MAVYKRGKKWYIDFRFARIRYRHPSPDNTCAGAKAYELTVRQRLARGETVFGPQEVTDKNILFKDFAEDWLEKYALVNNKQSEHRNKRSVLNTHLIPYFGKIKLENIKAYEIEKYKATKQLKGSSNKTINNTLGVLSKCLRTAEEWEFIKSAPKIKRLKVPPQKYDFLSVEESELLLNSTEGLLHDMILFALKTGLRFGEIIATTWDSINFQENILTVNQAISRGYLGSTKSNKIRYVPLAHEVVEMLQLRKPNSHLVFPHYFDDDKYLPQENCRRMLHNACKKIGMRQIGWHTFRHTFASRLAENGISMRTIQELLGHADTTTTMRYAHLSPVILREAIRTLERPVKIGRGHSLVTIAQK